MVDFTANATPLPGSALDALGARPSGKSAVSIGNAGTGPDFAAALVEAQSPSALAEAMTTGPQVAAARQKLAAAAPDAAASLPADPLLAVPATSGTAADALSIGANNEDAAQDEDLAEDGKLALPIELVAQFTGILQVSPLPSAPPATPARASASAFGPATTTAGAGAVPPAPSQSVAATSPAVTANPGIVPPASSTRPSSRPLLATGSTASAQPASPAQSRPARLVRTQSTVAAPQRPAPVEALPSGGRAGMVPDVALTLVTEPHTRTPAAPSGFRPTVLTVAKVPVEPTVLPSGMPVTRIDARPAEALPETAPQRVSQPMLPDAAPGAASPGSARTVGSAILVGTGPAPAAPATDATVSSPAHDGVTRTAPREADPSAAPVAPATPPASRPADPKGPVEHVRAAEPDVVQSAKQANTTLVESERQAKPVMQPDAPIVFPANDHAAAPNERPTVAADVPQPLRSGARIDMDGLVDAIARARSDAQNPAAPIAVALTHGEFGKVSMRFRADDDGLSVQMTSSDAGFAPAVASASQAMPAAQQAGGSQQQDQPRGDQPPRSAHGSNANDPAGAGSGPAGQGNGNAGATGSGQGDNRSGGNARNPANSQLVQTNRGRGTASQQPPARDGIFA